MPWPTYSERMLHNKRAQGWVRGAVPLGKRVVLKSLTVVNHSEVQGTVQVEVHGYLVYSRLFQATNLAESYDMMCVAYDEETVGIFCQAAGFSVMLFGFAFDDPEGGGGDFLEELPAATNPSLPQKEQLW